MAEIRTALPLDTNIEIWFQDEARIGQKNKITRRWAKKGTRPQAPKDQRTRSAYIFGAICPARGVGAGLVLPRCNTDAMNLHLKEISIAVAPGAHAIVIVDQAGWHFSKTLETPDNITLLPLPAKSPELNPVENICSSCAKTGSQTVSSAPTTILSIIAVSLGTSSSINHGRSCPSAFETGHMSDSQ